MSKEKKKSVDTHEKLKSVSMFQVMLNENMEFPHKNEMTLKHHNVPLRSLASFRTLKISNVKELNLEH